MDDPRARPFPGAALLGKALGTDAFDVGADSHVPQLVQPRPGVSRPLDVFPFGKNLTPQPAILTAAFNPRCTRLGDAYLDMRERTGMIQGSGNDSRRVLLHEGIHRHS